MPNQYEDAARILRELKDRVDRSQQSKTQEGSVNVFRGATETTLGVDTTTTATGTAGGWTWGSATYGYDEWGE